MTKEGKDTQNSTAVGDGGCDGCIVRREAFADLEVRWVKVLGAVLEELVETWKNSEMSHR